MHPPSVSVDLDVTAVKNRPPHRVRNGTSGLDRAESDRRVERTKTSLHHALLGLAREKPYPSIAVKEILDRANVGRSTFYAHFRDKDDLLESGIHQMLRSMPGGQHPGDRADGVVAFSLPLLQYIDEHRRSAGPKMKHEGRAAMHQRLRRVLTDVVAERVAHISPQPSAAAISLDLISRHIAATFVLVLNWWIEAEPAWTPEEVDAQFRRLVTPALAEVLR